MDYDDKIKYVEGGGACCPCGSVKLQSGSLEVEHGHGMQTVVCMDCGKHWVNIYMLVDVCDDMTEAQNMATKTEIIRG